MKHGQAKKIAEKMADITEETVAKIRPMLAGLGPEVQGAVLADLFAMYLAGHVGCDAEEVAKIREEVIETWLKTVRELVPFNERELLALIKKGAT